MRDEEVLKIWGQGRRQVVLLECSKEQDPKVFRYVGVCGVVRTGERHIRRGGRRKERRLVEAGGERGDGRVSRKSIPHFIKIKTHSYVCIHGVLCCKEKKQKTTSTGCKKCKISENKNLKPWLFAWLSLFLIGEISHTILGKHSRVYDVILLQ